MRKFCLMHHSLIRQIAHIQQNQAYLMMCGLLLEANTLHFSGAWLL
jgi:hypothetical protein